MKNNDIILMCRDSNSSVIVYNHLSTAFNVKSVIIESGPSRRSIIKKRAAKFGWIKVVNQLAFQIFIVKLLRILSKERIQKVINQSGMSLQPIPEEKIIRVDSVNDKNSIQLIKNSQVGLVVVNGTRIISKNVLEQTNMIFINMHAGITPTYRGVHGAYWAFVNKEDELAGVTVHYIDRGIDTGEVINQKSIKRTKADNFVVYPYLQVSAGLPLLIEAIKAILTGAHPSLKDINKRSGLYSHPTFFGYLYHFLTKGVK